MNNIYILLRIIKNNIGKILLLLTFVTLFLITLFPMSDLNDFVANEISKQTNKSVYLQFEDAHINPLLLSLTLDGVSVDTQSLNTLKMTQLTASPVLTSLLQKKPAGELKASGLFGGDMNLKFISEKNEDNATLLDLQMNAQKLSLKDLSQTLILKNILSGSLNMNLNLKSDLSFKTQPEGDLNLIISKFEYPSTQLNLGEMGQITTPDMKLEKLSLKGKIANGKIKIENAELGDKKDELTGTIKGDIDFTIQNNGGRPTPQVTGYNLEVNLLMQQNFVEKAELFLFLLDNSKKVEKNGVRYKFKVQASSLYMAPQISPLQ